MSYESVIGKSLHGRELGLNYPTSAQTGSTHNPTFLVGAEAVRAGVTTDDSTSSIIAPYGIHYLTTESSGVHTLAPPIPGVDVTIVNLTSAATEYVKTRNGETILSTLGTTQNTIAFNNGTAVVRLTGLTSSVYGIANGLPTGVITQVGT